MNAEVGGVDQPAAHRPIPGRCAHPRLVRDLDQAARCLDVSTVAAGVSGLRGDRSAQDGAALRVGELSDELDLSATAPAVGCSVGLDAAVHCDRIRRQQPDLAATRSAVGGCAAGGRTRIEPRAGSDAHTLGAWRGTDEDFAAACGALGLQPGAGIQTDCFACNLEGAGFAALSLSIHAELAVDAHPPVFAAVDLPLASPVVAAIALLVVTQVGGAVPTVPGRIGVFHALVVFTLGMFGIESGIALGYAVVMHIVVFGTQIVLGLAALWRYGVVRS